MKYIRTKDGRIIKGYKQVVRQFLEDKITFVQAQVVCPEIFNQADTIEELCDEFVVVDNEWKCILIYEHLDTTLKNIHRKDKAYGAIWVELPNGAYRLEPVAKLNDKGELELL